MRALRQNTRGRGTSALRTPRKPDRLSDRLLTPAEFLALATGAALPPADRRVQPTREASRGGQLSLGF